MYKLHEAVGNHSHVLETFNNMDDLAEFLEDRVREDIRANETEEDINHEEYGEHLRELYFSYYSIEELV